MFLDTVESVIIAIFSLYSYSVCVFVVSVPRSLDESIFLR